jgi:hypothetical protein
MDSILNSIKKLLGPSVYEQYFDVDIITHINSVFSRLRQLGVGPTAGFAIEDDLAEWNEFLGNDHLKLQMVKTYMYLKVKLRFDPPTNASVLKAMQEDADELEWCLNVEAESK